MWKASGTQRRSGRIILTVLVFSVSHHVETKAFHVGTRINWCRLRAVKQIWRSFLFPYISPWPQETKLEVEKYKMKKKLTGSKSPCKECWVNYLMKEVVRCQNIQYHKQLARSQSTASAGMSCRSFSMPKGSFYNGAIKECWETVRLALCPERAKNCSNKCTAMFAQVLSRFQGKSLSLNTGLCGLNLTETKLKRNWKGWKCEVFLIPEEQRGASAVSEFQNLSALGSFSLIHFHWQFFVLPPDGYRAITPHCGTLFLSTGQSWFCCDLHKQAVK